MGEDFEPGGRSRRRSRPTTKLACNVRNNGITDFLGTSDPVMRITVSSKLERSVLFVRDNSEERRPSTYTPLWLYCEIIVPQFRPKTIASTDVFGGVFSLSIDHYTAHNGKLGTFGYLVKSGIFLLYFSEKMGDHFRISQRQEHIDPYRSPLAIFLGEIDIMKNKL